MYTVHVFISEQAFLKGTPNLGPSLDVRHP